MAEHDLGLLDDDQVCLLLSCLCWCQAPLFLQVVLRLLRSWESNMFIPLFSRAPRLPCLSRFAITLIIDIAVQSQSLESKDLGYCGSIPIQDSS